MHLKSYQKTFDHKKDDKINKKQKKCERNKMKKGEKWLLSSSIVRDKCFQP